MINPLGVMAIVVPLLLLSSIGVSGYNSNLSLVKYALAQQGSNKTMSNMSNLAPPQQQLMLPLITHHLLQIYYHLQNKIITLEKK